jgi:hypothetical protein
LEKEVPEIRIEGNFMEDCMSYNNTSLAEINAKDKDLNEQA